MMQAGGAPPAARAPGPPLRQLAGAHPGLISTPGDMRYTEATAIWAKPSGRPPQAVAHCRTAEDVRAAVGAARAGDLSLSVRGGGHDWAGRALCDGLVIDLRSMNLVEAEHETAWVGGGATAADVMTVLNPLGIAAVTGALGMVGMAGLTLGGGYGPLIGRFGLALDNLLGAQVVLADGRIVKASHDNEAELFWALRGGGGNFGVVTAMHLRLHPVRDVLSGLLIFPFAEARDVLRRYAELVPSMPEALTVSTGFIVTPDGAPVLFVVPMWSGDPGAGQSHVAVFPKLGTLAAGAVQAMPYRDTLSMFDANIVYGLRTVMETCWLPELDAASIDVLLDAMAHAVSPGCMIVTHEFRDAATRVPVDATAFGLRREHILIEIVAAHPDQSDPGRDEQHRQWARATRDAFDARAMPGGYPNLLAPGDMTRAAASYGSNATRLIAAKRRYDPDNLFRSAIPLPAG